MNIYKGDCDKCGSWVGILNNFGPYTNGKYKILCGKCYWPIQEEFYKNV